MNRVIALSIFVLVQLFQIGKAETVFQNCFSQKHSDDVIFITSYHASWFEKQNGQYERTLLANFPKNNLIIYHEDDVPAFEGACMVDLRTIGSWFEFELNDKGSWLNQYYELAGFVDPVFEGKPGDIITGVALFMKVVSIYHAVHNSPDGSIVFWVDTDVSFRQELPVEVVDWIRKKDVTYIPLILFLRTMARGMPSNGFDNFDLSTEKGQKEALLQEWWHIESGLFAVTVSAKTKVFTDKAVWMYRGGMLDIARQCFARMPFCTDNERVRGNVYLNDIYVFTFLLQADAHQVRLTQPKISHHTTLLKKKTNTLSQYYPPTMIYIVQHIIML